jgi:hypothetical protein
MAAAPAGCGLRRERKPVGLGAGHRDEDIAALDLAAVRGDARGLDRAGLRIERSQTVEEIEELHIVSQPSSSATADDPVFNPLTTENGLSGYWMPRLRGA